jgi:hypothetical protein
MSLTKTWDGQSALAVSSGAGAAGTVSGNQIVSYSGDFSAGYVWVEASFDSGTTWQPVPNSRRDAPAVFGMICPDASVEYRFACIGIVDEVICYMGP